MIKANGKKLQDLNRKLGDPSFSLRLYSGWAVLALLIFGVFGFYSQISKLSRKNAVYDEMTVLNKSLEQKIALIKSEKDKLVRGQEGVEILDRVLPSNYGIQDYVVDLSFAVSEKGYGLRSFTTQDAGTTNSNIKASARLEGTGSFGELVRNVESLKRIAQVEGLSVKHLRDGYEVNLLLDIFVLK